MEMWREKGLAIADSNTVTRNKLGWKVPSQSGNGTYIVSIDGGEPYCTCQHFETTHDKCQHIYAIEFIIQKEQHPDGTTVVTETRRITYSQNWSLYDDVQTHEEERFVILLRDLCNGIPQPEQTFGRPRLPLSDMVFGITYKTYSTMSGRRFMPSIRDAATKALVTKCPSFASNARYLENPEITPLLKSLIEQSARPLKSIETDFAVDSSGFTTTTYDRWFDHKWGKERSQGKWIKAHLMCGVKTHIVTSVEVTPTDSADAPRLPQLVEATAKHFTINDVCADKAYSSKKNLHSIQMVNGTPYIPFKSYCKGSQGDRHFDGLWDRMWHYFSFNQEAFMQHYHKRSNVETTFSMIKMKFGAMVRAKTPVAQVNEVLCKILCHNICVLIQSMSELKLEPIFQTFDTEKAVVPKALVNWGF